MKRLIVLLVVLALLAVGAYLVEKPRMEREQAIREGRIAVAKLFPNLSKDSISKIVIDDGLMVTTIRKGEADNWEVSGDGENFWKSQADKIDEVLKNITEDLTEDTITSESADKHAKFEVTAELGTTVEVYTSGDIPAGKFFVGKQGPDYISTYVRRDGDDRVYRIPIQLNTIYGRELNGWRDKHLWEFDPSLVTEAYFKFGENAYRVRKDGADWTLLEPEEAKANGVKIESELKSLSELEGAGYSDKSLEETGLEEPESEIHLTFADGSEIKAFFSAEDSGYYHAYIEGKQESILRVPTSDFGPLHITALSQLKVDPELASGDESADMDDEVEGTADDEIDDGDEIADETEDEPEGN